MRLASRTRIRVMPAIGLSLALASSAVRAQSGRVAGVVVSLETGEPLPYSVVALPALGRERFTNDSGVFFFAELPVGPLVLRVRRLGYSPSDITFEVRPGQIDTLRVQLSRIALQLRQVTVHAFPPCTTPGPPRTERDSALAIIFKQVEMNAEQYLLLARAHPFKYTAEVVHARRLKATGTVATESSELVTFDSESRSRYQPGNLLERRGRGYYFRIPTLIDFTDRDFQLTHCFHYGGIATLDGVEHLRIDVVASERIKGADVNGTIYLDAENFQIRRTLLRMSRPVRQIRPVVDMEITTDFREVLPSIPLIARVWSVQTLESEAKVDFDTAFEEHRLRAVHFVKTKPGDDGRRPP